MQISIVSGKGGTGKTTLATRLFQSVKGSSLLDCDVEEPNAALFLDVSWDSVESFYAEYPVICEDKCTHCGACASFCRFKAILSTSKATLPLAERCHACRGCGIVCPEHAISYRKREVGKISRGRTGGGYFASGSLNVGEYSGAGIIRRLRESAEGHLIWIDGPPGTGCAAAAAAIDADFAILVAEPTPFGVSDMIMAVEMLEKLEVPFGVVVNKAGVGNREIYDYCRNERIWILAEFPFSRSMAECYAQGKNGNGSDNLNELIDKLTQNVLQKTGFSGVKS
jgi:MinD superfamily P-loop ATPase